MARKSQIVRLDEALSLSSKYRIAKLDNDYRFRFIEDMILRLGQGRTLSAKQRNWLDSLIDEGVPKPKGDLKAIHAIKIALETKGTEHLQNTLEDFLRKEQNGWSITEKQKAFRDRLLGEAEDIRVNGPWIPSKEQSSDLESCINLSKGRSQVYWSTHPGEYRACLAVGEWKSGDREGIDKWSVEKVLHSFRVGIRELQKPYAKTGVLVWTRVNVPAIKDSFNRMETSVVPALVAGPPTVDTRGRIVYPILANGEYLEKTARELMKRKPKNKRR